ncbi:MAG TPA: M15 family metallopeptidase [Candidatus Mediterraneibacter stercoripullorum]|nr:M15 family metallopeptidase [Candidatus Mediterraneibacter stercoripullorum]
MSYSKYKRSGEFRNDRRYQTVRLQRRRGRAETRLKTSVILSGVCILTAAFFLVICASYRTMEKQQTLFNDKKRRVIREGCPASMADKEAAKTVAWPGTSEHQLGLALDIVDLDYQQLDTRQEETPVQQWLMENSWKYGFILRYPTDKSEITGIIYEPWHYRYVGKEAAKVIHEKGICLEEYLENYQQNYPEES